MAVAEAVLVLQPRQQYLPEVPNVEDAKAWWGSQSMTRTGRKSPGTGG